MQKLLHFVLALSGALQHCDIAINSPISCPDMPPAAQPSVGSLLSKPRRIGTRQMFWKGTKTRWSQRGRRQHLAEVFGHSTGRGIRALNDVTRSKAHPLQGGNEKKNLQSGFCRMWDIQCETPRSNQHSLTHSFMLFI